MTETLAKYDTGIELEELPQPVKCPHCHMLIGWKVERDGVEVLRVGSLLIQSLRGRCVCGQEFSWRAPKKVTKAQGVFIVDELEI